MTPNHTPPKPPPPSAPTTLCSPCPRWLNSPAFSLVELLVVIAIMAMMVGLSAVAVQGFRAPAVQQAADQVMSGLSLARQTAITKNTRAAFLIAHQTNSGFPSEPFRHWAVVYMNKGNGTSAPGTPGEWTMAKDWEPLPNGAVFSGLLEGARTNRAFPSSTGSGSSITSTFFSSNYTTNISRINAGNTNFSATAAPCVAFDPSGTPIGDKSVFANSVGIRVSPGSTMAGNSTITGTNQYYIIEADHFVGRLRMRSPESY